LSRDPSGALNALDKIFDKRTVQEKQELANMFGELAFEAIGDLGLDENSPEKAALKAILGGIMSHLTGGSFASGAASAGIQQLLMNELANITDPALLQWTTFILGSVISILTGGDGLTGGSITLNDLRNNWLKHEHDRLISRLKEQGFTDRDIEKMQEGSRAADDESSLDNPLHSMPTESREDIISAFTVSLQNAINLGDAGMRDLAMYELGQALHTAEDYYSHYLRGSDGSWSAHFLNGWLKHPDNPNNNPSFFAGAGNATELVAQMFNNRSINLATVNSIFPYSRVDG
jgi:hypothetical protein